MAYRAVLAITAQIRIRRSLSSGSPEDPVCGPLPIGSTNFPNPYSRSKSTVAIQDNIHSHSTKTQPEINPISQDVPRHLTMVTLPRL